MIAIETPLMRLLGVEHPILLAPMGSAAGGKLAAAVTHAGGLGIIGSGYADSAAIRKELPATGNARVGIGLVTWALPSAPTRSRLRSTHDRHSSCSRSEAWLPTPIKLNGPVACSCARSSRWNRPGKPRVSAPTSSFSEKWHSREEELQTSRSDVEAAYLAASPDDFSVRAVWAGEGVDLVRDRQPAIRHHIADSRRGRHGPAS